MILLTFIIGGGRGKPALTGGGMIVFIGIVADGLYCA